MCGILVTVGLNRALHHRHLAPLRRRGPDAIGFWVNGDVGLAHTRLAVLGLDDTGIQPMENEQLLTRTPIPFALLKSSP